MQHHRPLEVDEALDTKDKYGSSLEMIVNKDQIHSYLPSSSRSKRLKETGDQTGDRTDDRTVTIGLETKLAIELAIELATKLEIDLKIELRRRESVNFIGNI